MKKFRCYILLVMVVSALGCEDVIDVDLKDAAPKLVIVGEVYNGFTDQQVTVNRTVAFSSVNPFDPVSGGEVTVSDDQGHLFEFSEDEPGVYRSKFAGEVGVEYTLHVRIDGNEYVATSRMPAPVAADSIGTGVRTVFDEERKYIGIKYQDPAGVPNYYRYVWSVNGGPIKTVRVSNDKYNDGKYVTEDVADFDTELKTGDSVSVWMQCIDKATFDFWNVVQSNNPGSAAPANPPSPFGSLALGYFSAQTVSYYTLTVQ